MIDGAESLADAAVGAVGRVLRRKRVAPDAAGDDTTPAAPRRRATKRAVTAGPSLDAPPPREHLERARLDALVEIARESLESDKAEDVVVLDVTGRASFTDRMVIATGLVERQIQAMATHLEEALGKAGLPLRRDRIQASPDWVLIDAGDLVIHLFRPEARATYALERMWGPDSPGADSLATPEGATDA